MSLSTKILIHLRSSFPNFIHGGELERFGQGLGFMASNVLRRARELEKIGLIEKRYNEKHEVMYRAKPIEEIEARPPVKIFKTVYSVSVFPVDLKFPPAFSEKHKVKVEATNQKSLFP